LGRHPPLLLVESRSLGGVLHEICALRLVDIAATNGQCGGFLHTDVVPALAGNRRPVLYLGDHDHQGGQIEENTRHVLERETGREIEWRRLALTREQIDENALEPVLKKDERYKPAKECEAWEVEALGQQGVEQLVRDELGALLPKPLEDVLEREQLEREDTHRRLTGAGADQ